ncbi:MAG TPA: helix-turn-helix domain-containing protein [Clostridia bacterium]|nr:helix-turn-helix domain-containing protein [Clostridia bacterium]
MDKIVLKSAWNLLDNVSDDNDKEEYGLYDIYYSISIKIFDYRMEKGLSQKQLGEILGITQVMVSKLESGEYNPTVEQLWKVSKKLGWDFRVVLEDNEAKAPQVWDNVEVEVSDNGNNLFKELELRGA